MKNYFPMLIQNQKRREFISLTSKLGLGLFIFPVKNEAAIPLGVYVVFAISIYLAKEIKEILVEGQKLVEKADKLAQTFIHLNENPDMVGEIENLDMSGELDISDAKVHLKINMHLATASEQIHALEHIDGTENSVNNLHCPGLGMICYSKDTPLEERDEEFFDECYNGRF